MVHGRLVGDGSAVEIDGAQNAGSRKGRKRNIAKAAKLKDTQVYYGLSTTAFAVFARAPLRSLREPALGRLTTRHCSVHHPTPIIYHLLSTYQVE